LSVSIAGHCAIGVELDPLGQSIEVQAHWYLEIVNVPVIEGVPVGRCLECLLIVVDLVLELLYALSML
jgi:hypothetical protein